MNNDFDVGIVGLGYVGLTLATAMAKAGLRVVGIEKRQEVVDLTNAGKPHFSETGLEEALSHVTQNDRLIARTDFDPDFSCDAYVITVGTPLDKDGKARLDMIEAATRQVASNMRDGALIILRSTVKIGTARDVVAPILRASGKSFDIAMCPERTLEGKAMQELRQLPQIVGADDESVRTRAAQLFGQLTNSVVRVSSLESAEIIKLVDNTFRDVQFGFANEVARLCDAFGVNGYEVIASGKLGYERTNVPLPGLVGGPCLEKDPHILFQSAKTKGIELEITRSARLVNERQPEETVAFILQELDRRGLAAKAPIVLMGMAFKGVPATDDLRGSMALAVLEALRKARSDTAITLYDPVIEADTLAKEVPGYHVATTQEEAFTGAAAVIITNNHPELGLHAPMKLYEYMHKNGFIYDYWNHFSNLTATELGSSYFAVGNAKEADS